MTPRPQIVPDAPLTSFERTVLAVCRFANENGAAKAAQRAYQRYVGGPFVRTVVERRLHMEGLDEARALSPPAGVLLCANHRTFFDQFIIAAALETNVAWMRRLYFPVRSNYFYETWGGFVVNAVVGGLVMYPPIFRDAKKSDWNKAALEEIAAFLGQKGAVVGMHPEGTRGKGPDPYELLPAQPGVGQIIMRARPTVLPVWINGLSNSFGHEIASRFRAGGDPIIIVIGKPVDFGTLLDGTPRPAQYKRVADHLRAEIARLGERERNLRPLLTDRRASP
ncbi:MAG TPA: lysophospholipid acyltransferase family protein [Haliangiales bacterium]|nr:lysophospholipid acyltransferase family protein [Haliangiales bacterium]